MSTLVNFEKDEKVLRARDEKPLTIEAVHLGYVSGRIYYCRTESGGGRWYRRTEIKEGSDKPPSFLADL